MQSKSEKGVSDPELTRRGGYVMPGGIDGHVHLCQDLQSGEQGRFAVTLTYLTRDRSPRAGRAVRR
jgi:imidazolonepropionase-like amidohydrolase